MMKLTGTHYAYARRRQQITVDAGDYGVRHAFRIVVAHGGASGVGFRIGSAAGTQDVVEEVSLGTGQHIISFVPYANVWIEFNHVGYDPSYVQSCEIHDDDDLTLTNGLNLSDISKLRLDQSGDVVYIGAGIAGQQQRELIRRGDDYSWSLQLHEPVDGPFRNINPSPLTLTPSATTGEITATASGDVFKPGHVGALFKMESVGQRGTGTLTAQNQFSSSVRVSGVGTARNVTLTITGTWTATVTLQRSVGDESNWVDVTSYTSNQAGITYNDALDNQIIYYRLGIKTGCYTSGTVVVQLDYATGSNTGIIKVTAVSDTDEATAVVLKALGSLNATEDWYEGRWSDYRGWPAAPCLHDGRLNWWGKDRLNGSVSDDYPSHDQDVDGDSGPVDRSIGKGPVDVMFWALSLARMISGGAGGIYAARTSALDEPITPSGVAIRQVSSQGSSSVAAVEIDEGAVFVSRSGQRVYEIKPDDSGWRMVVEDLTLLCPEFCEAGVTSIAVQHQPETRVHCVLSDGTVACLTYDRAEDVRAWWLFEMDDGTEDAVEAVIDVVVLPGDGTEDSVYYVVRSDTTFGLTKLALESECVGGDLNKQADLFVYAESAGTTLTVPTFLNGRTLYLWGDGEARGTAVVSAGSVTFPASYTNRMAGLYYEARFRSARLGKALGRRQPIQSIALLTHNTAPSGVEYGRNFTTMYPLPAVVNGTAVDADTVLEEYDEPAVAIGGVWRPNERLCIKAAAPNPARVLAAVVTTES